MLELLELGDLSEGHGRALLLAADHEDRRRLARDAAAEGWSVRTTEERARDANAAPAAARTPAGRTPHPDQQAAAAKIADALAGAFGIEVTVKPHGDGYRVELTFDDRTRPSRSPGASPASPPPEQSACRQARRPLNSPPFGRLAQSVRALL